MKYSFRDRDETKREREAFRKAYRADSEYARQLRKIARQIGDIVGGYDTDDLASQGALRAALARYSEIIRPWATAVAKRMLVDVSRRDKKAWASYARGMARSLRDELDNAPTGAVTRRLVTEQVDLITSLPIEAAERVQRLALESLETGGRAGSLAAEIMKTGEVTIGRANLIARTETARAASSLTQARAEHIGSMSYIWRTSKDGTVRPSHRKMEGVPVRWDSPPTLDSLTGHAGTVPNCRCYAEPVIPERFD